MRVGDLRLALEALPDDMLVLIDGTFHITALTKRPRRTVQGVPLADPPIPDQVAEPSLVIEGHHIYFGVRWNKPEPPWKLKGRWPRPRLSQRDDEALSRLLARAEGVGRE